MADRPIVPLLSSAEHAIRATADIHNDEMPGDDLECSAIVFNEEASLTDLLAYVKGQTRMANAFLDAVLGEPALSEFAFALQGLLVPAMNALDLASKSLAQEAP